MGMPGGTWGETTGDRPGGTPERPVEPVANDLDTQAPRNVGIYNTEEQALPPSPSYGWFAVERLINEGRQNSVTQHRPPQQALPSPWEPQLVRQATRSSRMRSASMPTAWFAQKVSFRPALA